VEKKEVKEGKNYSGSQLESISTETGRMERGEDYRKSVPGGNKT